MGTIGALLFLAVAVFLFYSINFLVKNAGLASEARVSNDGSAGGFNLQGLKELGIVK